MGHSWSLVAAPGAAAAQEKRGARDALGGVFFCSGEWPSGCAWDDASGRPPRGRITVPGGGVAFYGGSLRLEEGVFLARR